MLADLHKIDTRGVNHEHMRRMGIINRVKASDIFKVYRCLYPHGRLQRAPILQFLSCSASEFDTRIRYWQHKLRSYVPVGTKLLS